MEVGNRESEVVELVLDIGPSPSIDLPQALCLCNGAQDVTSIGIVVNGMTGNFLELEQRRADLPSVAGELAPDVKASIVGNQHDLVAGTEIVLKERPHGSEYPIAIEGTDIEIVDVDDKIQFLRGRRR